MDFKTHVGRSENNSDHCTIHALSDPINLDFSEDCQHLHDTQCDRCESLDKGLKEILKIVHEIDVNDDHRARMEFENRQCSRAIHAWKAHLLRSVNQEEAKQDALTQLDEETCLIVADWAMKFLPQYYREQMSEFYSFIFLFFLCKKLLIYSLLNVDYKILTKAIAKRLEKVLPKIINPDQTGYVKNRYIGENVRLILDIMSYTEEKNLPGAALFIDFRKAFDTIEWNFLTDTLNNFNFGADIQNWVRIFYNNVTSCVLNNGHASEFFPLERGVRQGCLLSGLLFVTAIEVLANAIKNKATIKGIKVDQKEIKVSLYADDTTVFVRDLESITHLLALLNDFKILSGLEINTSKTEGMWLGCWKNNTDTPFGFR